MGVRNFITCRFTEKTISPTTIYHKPKGKAEIVVGLPIQYRRKYITCLLNHEIGTHFLRKHNDRKQIWFEHRKKYKLGKFLSIEEGLAAINMLFEQANRPPHKPFLFQAALNYFSAYLASYMGFQELFFTLRRYVHDEEKLWRQCMRVKRSLKDTSTPGGMFKDQVYLRGAHELLTKRKNIDFRVLYSGKLNLKDLRRLLKEGLVKTGKIYKIRSSCLIS